MPTATSDALDGAFDVVVVGSGPAGLAAALGCRDCGLSVLLLEAGGLQPVPGRPDVIAAERDPPNWHDPVEIVSAAALGGTSHWWGGRAVPFTEADFAAWPIGMEELRPWYEDAAEFLGVRTFQRSPPPGAFAQLADFDAAPEEVWCPQINMAKRWARVLGEARGPEVLLGARVVGLNISDARVTSVRVRMGDGERTARGRHFVLACGGLGGLRLLLLAQREQPRLFGGPSGQLGRGYMGHLTGVIAFLAPRDADNIARFAFRPIADNLYARRQINLRQEAMAREGLGNIGFWLDDPSNENPAHGSSVASAKYVAARLARFAASLGRHRDPAPLQPHLDNVARAPLAAAGGLARALYLLAMAQVTGRLPRPQRFIPAQPGAWLMRYHAEVRPDPENRVRLSDTGVDSIGMPKLHVRYRPGDGDFASVVRAHELLDRDLQQSGAGSLRWRTDESERLAMVSNYGNDGYHQLGGAAMSADPHAGIVDSECRVHDLENLWVASSSVFPTGAQANPTLTIVALARRLAARLAQS